MACPPASMSNRKKISDIFHVSIGVGFARPTLAHLSLEPERTQRQQDSRGGPQGAKHEKNNKN